MEVPDPSTHRRGAGRAVVVGVEETVEDLTHYIREPNGALIARVTDDDWKLYHFDALGSTVALTDDSGDVTDTYGYDAWGNVVSQTGSTEQPYQYVGQLGYYTHWQDEPLQTGAPSG